MKNFFVCLLIVEILSGKRFWDAVTLGKKKKRARNRDWSAITLFSAIRRFCEVFVFYFCQIDVIWWDYERFSQLFNCSLFRDFDFFNNFEPYLIWSSFHFRASFANDSLPLLICQVTMNSSERSDHRNTYILYS